MPHQFNISTLGLGLCLALAPQLSPEMASSAKACGGTFCDAGPGGMPVDQTGENILFVMENGEVEAHIQIQIDPDIPPSQFAWVIPMMTVPEFSLGSDNLFSALLNGSVPRYGMRTQVEPCGTTTGAGTGTTGSSTVSGTATGGEDSGSDTGDTMILAHEVVGAFEIVALTGGSIESIMDWLGDNGYQQDPAAVPILRTYLEEGYLFVALKLRSDSGVDEIQPIVLRYPGDESCVPIRLTRIAAAEDLDLRVFFLGDARVVPTNYRHVLVNPLRIDWFDPVPGYARVISQAVDEADNGGMAFVTEYAGPSAVVQLNDPRWAQLVLDIAALGDDVEKAADLFISRRLMNCDFSGQDQDICQMGHPLLRSILQTYLPVPEGLSEREFYQCVACNSDLVNRDAWDAQGMSDTFLERIHGPQQHGLELLQRHDYLTRMYTRISPDEMNADPTFARNPELDNVTNVRFANRLLRCDLSSTVTLPDGREVHVAGAWPDFPDELPWVDEVQVTHASGPAEVVADRRAESDRILAAWNEQFTGGGTESVGDTSSASTQGDASTGAGTSDSSAGSSSDSSAEAADTHPPLDSTADESSDGDVSVNDAGSCACTSRGTGPSLAELALLLVFPLAGQRWRRRSTQQE